MQIQVADIEQSNTVRLDSLSRPMEVFVIAIFGRGPDCGVLDSMILEKRNVFVREVRRKPRANPDAVRSLQTFRPEEKTQHRASARTISWLLMCTP